MTTSMWTNTRHFFSTMFQVKPAPVLPDPTCAAPWQPAPWTKGRVGHAQFGVIALLMVLVNYACVVIYPSVNSQVRGGHVSEDYFVRILLFHVPLILAIASWIATCIVSRLLLRYRVSMHGMIHASMGNPLCLADGSGHARGGVVAATHGIAATCHYVLQVGDV